MSDQNPPRRPGGGGLDRLKAAALVLPVVLLASLLGLDYFVVRNFLPPGQAQLFIFVVGIAGVVAFSLAIFSRLSMLHERVSEQNERLTDLAHALERKQEQLRALNSAGLTLSAELATGTVLQRVVELARTVANARYAALGVFDQNGRVKEFLTSGITPEERARIGPLPVGRGILGHLQREQRPIRLRDLKDHPASVPFPPNHPEMHSFIGIPIRSRGRNIGNLYLTEKVGAPEFGEDDEEALLTLAAQAAIAIENARLYEQVQQMAVLEERNRIGMDLHDGAIQSLYGLGLLIEDAADQLAQSPLRKQLDLAVDRLNGTISDLRGYILGLRPSAAAGKPLRESLATLAEQTRANTALEVAVDVRPEAETVLDPKAQEAVFYIAADAFGNIARHAHASHARLALFRDDSRIVLEISDDGVGFDPEADTAGHGLRNMEDRAASLGGRIELHSEPRRGTRMRVELPVKAGAR